MIFLFAGIGSAFCLCVRHFNDCEYNRFLKIRKLKIRNFPWSRDISVASLKIFKYIALSYIIHVCGFVLILKINKNKFHFLPLLYECNFIF